MLTVSKISRVIGIHSSILGKWKCTTQAYPEVLCRGGGWGGQVHVTPVLKTFHLVSRC